MSPPNSILTMSSRDAQGKVKLRTYSKDPWGQKNVQGFIDAWGLTQEQIDKMWALRAKLKDVDHWKNEPETVLRFMVAPHGYDAAEGAFRKMIQWRLDNRVDAIFDEYEPPQELLENSSAAILHGLDRDGDPIYVERGGATDVTSLLKKYGRDELIRFSIWTRELHTRGAWIEAYEKQQGRRIKGIAVVYDLKGMSTKHLNSKVLDLFGDIMKFSHANYPGPIKRMIIVRAPQIFTYAWAVAKHFFRQSMRKKMIFAGKDYLEVLDEFIPRDVLPPSIADGGTGRVAIGMPYLVGDVDYQQQKMFTMDSPLETSLVSLTDSDDGSATSNCSAGSVSSSGLFKGVWMEQEDGGTEVFTRSVA